MSVEQFEAELSKISWSKLDALTVDQKQWVIVTACWMVDNDDFSNDIIDDVLASHTGITPGYVPTNDQMQNIYKIAHLMLVSGKASTPTKYTIAGKVYNLAYAADEPDLDDGQASDGGGSDDEMTVDADKLMYAHVQTQPMGDLSKLSMRTVYGFVTQAMKEDTVELFNRTLKMPQGERVKLCWALAVSKAAMMVKSMTDADIRLAAGLPTSEWQDPYEYYTVLADTIVTKVIAYKGAQVYFDPGETDGQVFICRIGAVINHTKHNVAFGVEENVYQLTRFVNMYMSKHPDIVRAVQQKMEVLPKDGSHGLYMKYRPKRKIYVDEYKRKDYNRLTVGVYKHGSYASVDFSVETDTELLALAMTSLAPSPLALYSLMKNTPESAAVLAAFEKKAESVLPSVPADNIMAFYNAYEDMVQHKLEPGDFDFFSIKQLDDRFSAALKANVIPVIAKDKGIYNSLLRVLQPYGSTTIVIGQALYEFDKDFSARKWLVLAGADVAKQLNLDVSSSDNLTAPSRSGYTHPFASGAHTIVNRSCKRTRHNVEYGKPVLATRERNFIDLAFNCSLYSITDEKVYQKHRAAGRSSEQDFFAYDNCDTAYCSVDLFVKDKGDKVSPRFDSFVVVMPVKHLTAAFCKRLFTYYTVTCALGGLGMNFSVYLIGTIKIDPKPDNVGANYFPYWCATLLFMRLQLYNRLYAGYPLDVAEIVFRQHEMINQLPYVDARVDIGTDSEFLALFAKARRTLDMSVVEVKPISGLKNLTVNTDIADDDDDFGIYVS